MSLNRDRSGTLPWSNLRAARLMPLGTILTLLEDGSFDHLGSVEKVIHLLMSKL